MAPVVNVPRANGNKKPRVLMIAPVGVGVGGIICQTNALVCTLNQQDLVDLKVIDSTQRYRDDHELTFCIRAWGGGLQAARKVVELSHALVTFKPESVQIRSSASLGLIRDVVLVALARLMGPKTYVSFHFGRIPQLASQRNWEWRLLGWVVRMASGVQVLDRHSLEALVDNYPNCAISQVTNSIDLDWIDEIRDRVAAKSSQGTVPKLVFVGMVLASKGVVELVESCSTMVDADFELEMVGSVGPEMRERLCGIASRRNAGRWLKFSGPVARATAVERIAAADVFVLPSYTEGFPGSMLEAMACGTAIVATGVGAIPEMLLGDDGEAVGLIVPPRDTRSLALALEDLLKNRARRLELAAAARRKCEAHYQLSDRARRWVELWTGGQVQRSDPATRS